MCWTMKSLDSIRKSALAKRGEIAEKNAQIDRAVRARRVEVARRESELREASRPAQSDESRWEAMAMMKPWETLVTRGGRTWAE